MKFQIFGAILPIVLCSYISVGHGATQFQTSHSESETYLNIVSEKSDAESWEILTNSFAEGLNKLPGIKTAYLLGQSDKEPTSSATHTKKISEKVYYVEFQDDRIMPPGAYNMTQTFNECNADAEACVSERSLKIQGPIFVHQKVHDASSVAPTKKPFELNFVVTKMESKSHIKVNLNFSKSGDYISYFNQLKEKGLVEQVPTKKATAKTFLILARLWAEGVGL